jgi:hypothetical protein
MSPALAKEVLRNRDFAGLVREWELQDKIRHCDSKLVREEQKQVAPQCKSNDPHIIALVNIGHVEAVVTQDKNLISDLRNAQLVGHRRKVLKENDHSPGRTTSLRKVLNRLNCP